MINTLITHLQIFGIGVSLGLAGPCLVACTPAVLFYTSGTKTRRSELLADILIFLSGRTLAYVMLGCIAGLSAGFLRRFISQDTAVLIKPVGGILSIILGLAVLFCKPGQRACRSGYEKAGNFAGLFSLGFLIGLTPCAPLAALLFEIVLISKNVFEGASYALSFGAGTALSAFVVMAVLAGILSWIPAEALRSDRSKLFFRILCAAFLVVLGLTILL